MKNLKVEIKSFEVTTVRQTVKSECRVYRESNLAKIIDGWFSENQVFALNFKCKTWNKLIRLATKLEADAIRKNLGLNESATVRFSSTAGCRCGCSPGFVVKGGLFFQEYWVKMEFETNLVELLPGFTKMLKDEIESMKEAA